jgi:hypothetical protein
VATRMLQKYPSLVRRTSLVISINGYIHYEDYELPNKKRLLLAKSCKLLASLPLKQSLIDLIKRLDPAYFKLFANSNLNTLNSSHKLNTDIYTLLKAIEILLTVDNCHKRINVPLKHIFTETELIDNNVQKQHLQIVYKNYKQYKVVAPKYLSENIKKNASYLLPSAVRRVLANAKA